MNTGILIGLLVFALLCLIGVGAVMQAHWEHEKKVRKAKKEFQDYLRGPLDPRD